MVRCSFSATCGALLFFVVVLCGAKLSHVNMITKTEPVTMQMRLVNRPQFIVGEDGTCGLVYEHSPAEGPPIVFLIDYVVKYM